MRFTISIKDPDVLGDAIRQAVQKDVEAMGLSKDERETIEEMRREKVAELCGKWFRWGEYFAITVDTDARTATVDEAGE